jgi:hypothetical protein
VLLPTQDNKNKQEEQAYIYASSGIWTHDPSVQAGEDISCLMAIVITLTKVEIKNLEGLIYFTNMRRFSYH